MSTLATMSKVGTAHQELTLFEIQTVALSRESSINSLEPKVKIGFVMAAIEHVVKNYGARVKVEKSTVTECYKIATESFGKLAAPEIVQAYRLWAAQRFDALEMYGGQFNATQFGRVLAAYKRFRAPIYQGIAKEIHQDAANKKAEARAQVLRKRYEKSRDDFPKTVASVKETGRFVSPEQLPVHWYDFAEYNLLIELAPGEKVKFWNRAVEDIDLERQELIEVEKDKKDVVGFRKLLEHFAKTGEAAVKMRAKQYILWTKVLGRDLAEEEVVEENDQKDTKGPK